MNIHRRQTTTIPINLCQNTQLLNKYPQLVSNTRSGQGMRCHEAPILQVREQQRCRPNTPDAPSQGLMDWNEMDDMSVEKWNEICGRGKREKPREKPTQTPFRPSRNPHGETQTRTRDPSGGRRAPNRLRHEAALNSYYRCKTYRPIYKSIKPCIFLLGKQAFTVLLHSLLYFLHM